MFSLLKNERPFIRAALPLLLAVFFLAGLFSVFHYGDSFLLGSLETFDNDDVKYIRSAWTLMDSGVFSYKFPDQPTVFIMPGLTFLLAFFMSIFGKVSGIVAYKVFAVLLQTASLYLLFAIGKKVFNSTVAFMACILNVIYVVDFWVANLVLTESVFKFLLLLLIYISLYAVERKSLKLYLIGAVVWVLAIYFRPTIGAFPLVILFLWLKKRYSWRDMVKYTLAVLTVFLVLMSPWWIRNYLTFDRFIPLTLSSGNPFLQGTYIDYDQTRDYLPYTIGENEIETDRIEKETGIERLKAYAGQNLTDYIYWYTVGKSVKLWDTPFYWQSVFSVPFSTVFRVHQFLLISGISGLIFCCFRRKTVYQPFLFLILVYFTLVYLPYYTFARYAYPILPLLTLFGAYALYCAGKAFSVLLPHDYTRK